jgi:putative transposase
VGVLLAYNLVRYQMIKMAGHLKGYWPNQLSFSESCGMVMRMLMTLQGASPGRIPELMRDLESMGQLVKLPTRRERAFPRVVKERPWRYPTALKKKPVSCLTDWHYNAGCPFSCLPSPAGRGL